MRRITDKTVQVHEACICGYNSVYTETYHIKWSKLSAAGIRRKKDRKTGKPFLTEYIFYDKCFGHDYYGWD